MANTFKPEQIVAEQIVDGIFTPRAAYYAAMPARDIMASRATRERLGRVFNACIVAGAQKGVSAILGAHGVLLLGMKTMTTPVARMPLNDRARAFFAARGIETFHPLHGFAFGPAPTKENAASYEENMRWALDHLKGSLHLRVIPRRLAEVYGTLPVLAEAKGIAAAGGRSTFLVVARRYVREMAGDPPTRPAGPCRISVLGTAFKPGGG